jgi:PEP-CTERM motif
MYTALQKTTLIASTALSLSFVTYSAEAYPLLPGLPNLNFTSYVNAPKDVFSYVQPSGWIGGTGLISVDAPGTATQNVQAHGNAYPVYVDPGPVPNAGNYIQADGNPTFETSFGFVLTGLDTTPGSNKYTLSFYQAAGQQTTFNGDTTEQWIVSLSDPSDPLVVSYSPPGCGNGTCVATYGSADPGASIAASNLMHTPSHGGTPWQFTSVTLTANHPTELLSFLAWGNNGSTVNEPPTVFLTAVNAPPGLVPEPATLGLVGVGLVGLGAVARRRRAKRSTAN